MGWFQLDPESIAERVRASGQPFRAPSLGASLLRGVIGFTVVSVAGFCPWALGGHVLGARLGEAGLYAVCAAVFLGLSGPLLHPLILGPGSFWRFNKVFGIAFLAYAVAWTAGWMGLRGNLGSLTGLLVGTALMGLILSQAFGAPGAAPASIALLFLLNTLGYFAGGWVEGKVAGLPNLSFAGISMEKPAPRTAAMLLWGVCYGLGFGAGLGAAFHVCQAKARVKIAALGRSPAGPGSP